MGWRTRRTRRRSAVSSITDVTPTEDQRASPRSISRIVGIAVPQGPRDRAGAAGGRSHRPGPFRSWGRAAGPRRHRRGRGDATHGARDLRNARRPGGRRGRLAQPGERLPRPRRSGASRGLDRCPRFGSAPRANGDLDNLVDGDERTPTLPAKPKTDLARRRWSAAQFLEVVERLAGRIEQPRWFGWPSNEVAEQLTGVGMRPGNQFLPHPNIALFSQKFSTGDYLVFVHRRLFGP